MNLSKKEVITMSLPHKYHWVTPIPSNYHTPLSIILDRRHQDGQFVHPDFDTVHDPWRLHDMRPAINRIHQALDHHEKITIYGDYDADGITSTTVMYTTLKLLGANVHYYVPNRFKDGYGPSKPPYQRIVNDGTTLLITVDNGVSGKNVIDPIVNSSNLDVIITDHHELPDQLPTTPVAIVHPRYPGTTYPFGDLSGVGVAFKVAWALLGTFPAPLLDLVAIGEIADVVSVTDENRYLIQQGLKAIQLGIRPGIRLLTQITGLAGHPITSTDIGFTLAPRLNALGRLSDASLGVELLATNDLQQATKLVNRLEELNGTRQYLVKQITQQAQLQAQAPENQANSILLITGHNWHQGVLGIVASNLMDEFNKPTIVVSQTDGQNYAKGSGRSFTGFDLYQALDPHRDLMVSFGGHPGACGLSIDLNQAPALQTALNQAANDQGFDPTTTQPDLNIDLVTTQPQSLTTDLYKALAPLNPYGPGNLEPHIELQNVILDQVQTMGQNDEHLKLIIGNLTIVAFNWGKYVGNFHADMHTKYDLVGTLNLNRWRGQKSIQLLLIDARESRDQTWAQIR